MFSNRRSLAGFVLAIAGALLDFASTYLIFMQSETKMQSVMGLPATPMNNSAIIWGVSLTILGAVLVVTAFASISSFGRNNMPTIGGLMLVYGIIMLFLGVSMFSGITPMMQGSLLSSIGMFIVGALMILNGIRMQRVDRMM